MQINYPQSKRLRFLPYQIIFRHQIRNSKFVIRNSKFVII